MDKEEKLYMVMDDTVNIGKGPYPPGYNEQQKKEFDELMKKLKEKYKYQ